MVIFKFQAECPDVYRGKYTDLTHPGADFANLYAGEVDAIIEDIHKNKKEVCCYIAESLQSCGGQIIYPPGYLKKVAK